ncbi:MAG: 4Fe-4S dicluster domain-containing protein [Candidatus Aminicenantes bacterium]|nr:MAG: 4Fe-4S dicluster domain-containing protein [Candidatus Aminicenantes bacterium]
MKVEIYIIKERCKGCGICVEVCQAKVLELSEELNSQGFRTPNVKNLEECLNCGMCEMFCSDFAIWVSIETEKVGV